MGTYSDKTSASVKEKSFHLECPADWRNIFDTITDMITIHDTDFNIIYANASAQKFLRLPPLKYAEKCFLYYHGKSCPPDGCPSCRCMRTGRPASFEIYEPHLGRYIEIRAIPRFDERKDITGLVHIVRDISERKTSERLLRESRKEFRSLVRHLLTVREEERKHVAREIHDELAQSLTSLKLDLFLLKNKLPPDDASFSELTKSMSRTLDSTVKWVKNISSLLRPTMLDELGLMAAIRWEAKRFHQRTGIGVRIQGTCDAGILNGEQRIAIFRIFQEALTNVTRHAQASRIAVRFDKTDGRLLVTIHDNGKGIRTEDLSSPQSLGLIGMQERARACGGNVRLQSVRGQGTTLTIYFTLQRQRKEAQSSQMIQRIMESTNYKGTQRQ